MARNNAAPRGTIPARYSRGPDEYSSLAEQMAAFDALPKKIRMALKYLPCDVAVRPIADFVAANGQRRSVTRVLSDADRMWRDFGAEPLRP